MYLMDMNVLATALAAALVAGSVWGQEVTVTLSLPAIGQWLLADDGNPAHWLGVPYRGRTLVEPINVVLVDPFSATSDAAIDKLVQAAASVGFGEKGGHSSGYWALIGSEVFPQISSHDNTAVADGLALFENNHGRVFGPLRDGDRWVFVGALSREALRMFPRWQHQFVSFNLARDEFAQRLSEGEFFRVRGTFPLGNVCDSPEETTADHDGLLVVLEAIR